VKSEEQAKSSFFVFSLHISRFTLHVHGVTVNIISALLVCSPTTTTTEDWPRGVSSGTSAVSTSISSDVGFATRSYESADAPVSPIITIFSGAATEKPKPKISIVVPTGPVVGFMRVTVGGSCVTTFGPYDTTDPQAAKAIHSASAVQIRFIAAHLRGKGLLLQVRLMMELAGDVCSHWIVS